jgi:hypothetical protein
MPATPIVTPLPEERLVGIEPQLLQQVADGWRHRLNLFTGRALTDTALTNEQLYRAGLLATLGQSVAPGVLSGLALSMQVQGTDAVLSIAPGYGISAVGEDVLLPRTLTTNLSTLAVVDPASGAIVAPFSTYVKGTSASSAGVLLLQPVTAQATGAELDTGPIIASGNLSDSCDTDPATYAYEDLQIVDAAQLVFVPWVAGGPVPALPAATPAATWRNRLAYALFAAESQFTRGAQFPWALLGVPVALLGLGTNFSPLFVDRSSVVRAGGLVRSRYLLPPELSAAASWKASTAYAVGALVADPAGNVQEAQTSGTSGAAVPAWNPSVSATTTDGGVTWLNTGPAPLGVVQPALAQARVSQLAEQMADAMSGSTPFGNLSDIATALPPCGALPAAALDFVGKAGRWFPRNWALSVAPVYAQELEAVLETGLLEAPIDALALAPADPNALQAVDVLVPLPDADYDPDVLVTETVAPDFQHEIDAATQTRDAALRERKSVLLGLNALYTALGPNVPMNPNTIDPGAGLTGPERAGSNRLPPFLQQDGDILSPATWRPATAYVVGQFVVDPNGNIQSVKTAGTSGAAQPVWNSSPGGSTSDGTPTITWFNVGPGTWQPNTAYALGQFVFDSNGALQMVTGAGTSGASFYIWATAAGGRTVDGNLTWIDQGPPGWQRAHAYTAGQAAIDVNGNVQVVQTAGTSGSAAPAWGTDLGQITADGSTLAWVNEGPPTLWEPLTAYTKGQSFVDPGGNLQSLAAATAPQGGSALSGSTQTIWNRTSGATTTDGSVTWTNAGPGTWLPSWQYAAGAYVLDANGYVQTVETAGVSGAVAPPWNTAAARTTVDGSVTWRNDGAGTWRANTAFALGAFVFDPSGNLQTATTAGTSGATQPAWSTTAAGVTSDNTVRWQCSTWSSQSLGTLVAAAGAAPYTVAYTDPSNAQNTITVGLLDADDFADLTNYGLQHFINRLSAKISSANDLLDLAFLTSQTDIYRFRQNVLTTIDASKLATSPVLSNIATGDTAAATADQLQTYFTTLSPAPVTPQPAPAPTPGSTPPASSTTSSTTGVVSGTLLGSLAAKFGVAKPYGLSSLEMRRTTIAPVAQSGAARSALGHGPEVQAAGSRIGVKQIGSTGTGSLLSGTIGEVVPTPIDITQQSAIVGAQLDIRTLTIGERLAQSPSQEALFYGVGNRIAFLQALLDLEITIDDLPFLVDALPATGTTTTSSITAPPVPTETHLVAELRSSSSVAWTRIQTPQVAADIDEAGLFSVGVRVVEQHTQLMRALEGRVQTYVDFVNLCTAALTSVQQAVSGAQAQLATYENALAQARQDVAFTSALLADEMQRVAGVNATRQQVLANVQVVAYARPRTLDSSDGVPSRQLMPGNLTSPVPVCLQQQIAVPQDLRDLVAQLRDAPLSWFPNALPWLGSIGRIDLLTTFGVELQARATLALSLPLKVTDAQTRSDPEAPAIAGIFTGQQQTLQPFQAQRASFAPASLAEQSWSTALAGVTSVAALGDLLASSVVPAEIAGNVARTMQQVSSVAACLYTRANAALPADRLAWATFLTGIGSEVWLQNLAVLPQWNTQAYSDRQQMQQLADWLFTQIDSNNAAATAFMSDVVRTALLLACDVPLGGVVTATVGVRKLPVIGTTVTLNVPSATVASGTYVQLYAQGTLAAEGVVSDLDATTVTASITAVHVPDAVLDVGDTAYLTTQGPQALVLRAFSG